MAKHKSAEKRARQAEKARIRNRSWKSRIKTSAKKILKAIEEKDFSNIDELFRSFVSVIDRAAGKGVIKRNTAARKKSRMAKRILAAKTVQNLSS